MADPPLGFVGPETVTESALLVNLAEVAALLFVIGFVREIDYVSRALFGAAEGLVAHVPWLGKRVAGGLHSIEKRVSYALGVAGSALDERMGAAFHGVARQAQHLTHLLYELSTLQFRLNWLLLNKLDVPGHIAQLGRVVRTSKTTTVKQTVTIRKTKIIEKTINAPMTGRIGAAIRTQLKPLRVELRHFERHTELELKRLRLRPGHAVPARGRPAPEQPEKTVRENKAQGKRIGRIEKLLTVTALTGLVTMTIGRAGGGWIFCRNWRQVGRNVCGMNNGLLQSLLSGLIAIGSLLSIVLFAEACLAAGREVLPFLQSGVKELHGVAPLEPPFSSVSGG